MSRPVSRWIAGLAVLLGLAAIVTAQLGPNRSRIENDLTRRATAALSAAGQTGTRVSFTGRDGVIVTSEADAGRARSVVEAVTGVRAVTTRVLPAAVPPPVTATGAPRNMVVLAEDVRATVDLMLLREQLSVVPPLRFEFGGAGLTTDSRAALRKAAALLADHPDGRIRIGGHTDARGSKATNLRLSRERAEAVRAALRDLGVAADRMTAVGYGEARPAAPNDTAGHRAANRRVELSVS
ncbi:OmpA family protein [Actinoplanes philippinensis]|uniref:OmpA family protein n=1 Tax=Actinoplanes philippinensis TaxID=35752 RepID=UPI0033FF4CAB